MPRSLRNALTYWPIVVVLVVADRITKSVAEAVLWPRGVPRAVFGDAEWFRWTLVYNPGAAFGLHLGPYSRWIFLALTVGALGILYHLSVSYTHLRAHETVLDLVCRLLLEKKKTLKRYNSS